MWPKPLQADKSLLTSLATGPLQHHCALCWPLSCESLRIVPSSHRFQPKDPADKLVGFTVLSTSDAEAERQPMALCLLPAPAARAVPTSPQSISIQQPPGERPGPCQPAPCPPSRASSQCLLPWVLFCKC